MRNEADMTQQEFADYLGVSKVLITMIETGKKESSRKLVNIIAEKLNIHPASLMPFLGIENDEDAENLSSIERRLFQFGLELQEKLILKKARKIKSKHAEISEPSNTVKK
jgi:transcriptional regulator with XRE-family HTH domain